MAKKPTEADAGRLARRAAEYLETHNWGQGSLEVPVYSTIKFANNTRLQLEEYGVCLSGALNKAYCGNPNLTRERVAKIPLLNLTHELLDHFLGMRIEPWNDRFNRTKEEVIQQLCKFADQYDPKRD